MSEVGIVGMAGPGPGAGAARVLVVAAKRVRRSVPVGMYMVVLVVLVMVAVWAALVRCSRVETKLKSIVVMMKINRVVVANLPFIFLVNPLQQALPLYLQVPVQINGAPKNPPR
jgi:hypothetical protein